MKLHRIAINFIEAISETIAARVPRGIPGEHLEELLLMVLEEFLEEFYEKHMKKLKEKRKGH